MYVRGWPDIGQGNRLLGLLLVGTGVFNIIDYYVTVYALEVGFGEGNPVVAWIMRAGYFTEVKLLVVPVLLVGVWLGRERVGRRVWYYVWVVFVCYGGLMVYFGWLFRRGYL
jgi:hypothetical protein